ncbi:hypothetical protein TorRG33x02_256170 [Trema orientale]|uniref:Transmembrane protein n=1 Tax=Trema orientale TaxID=63057 RepID=A0A2P5DBK4_TREOI|nr:hypothetical protein TorRG33x02_256170 [Trema orientale]
MEINLVGHVLTGLCFLAIGLWHLFNHIKLHAFHPESYTAQPWFPTSKSRYLELFFSMGIPSLTIMKELIIPSSTQPLLDPHDGTIPFQSLVIFEHFSFFFAYFVYGAFAILLDLSRSKARYGLTLFLNALAYLQGLFLVHFHSIDHKGPLGQYHLLLQLLILVVIATFILGISLSKSFLVSFVRSLTIVFIGVWFIFMGVMLWTPALVPKGCFWRKGKTGQEVKCSGEEAIQRATSLVNLQFSWFTIGITILGIALYLALVKVYGKKVHGYLSVVKEEEMNEGSDNDNIDVTLGIDDSALKQRWFCAITTL